MAEFIIREEISADLKASQKNEVIREMVENLRLAGYFKRSEPEDPAKAILKRELLSSTGIADGVAIPHAKHPRVERLLGTAATSPNRGPFDSGGKDPARLLARINT